MTRSQGATCGGPEESGRAKLLDMETVVGRILLVGILLSLALIVSGLLWHWTAVGHLRLEYTIAGMNLFQFVLTDVQQLFSSSVHPRVVVSSGIAVLMLTPYIRVFSSTLYFAFVEHNWKYTVFTGLVLGVLTYSLFVR